MRVDILEKKEAILNWIREGKSKNFICRELKCKPDTLTYIKKMKIEYKGTKGWNKSITGLESKSYIPAKEYLGTNRFIKSNVLKKKLILEGIKEEKCERCGLSIWLGGIIPLELHHKNGNHWDNDLDNLEILCPNCHSLESNNSGAANKKWPGDGM